MFDLDQWQEIRVALAANKLRTLLTAFGIFWGIFLLVVMLGAGRGLENGVKSGFSGGATNSFFVWSMTTSKPFRGLPSGRRIQLTNEDVVAIRQQVPEAQVVAARNQLGGWRGGDNGTRGTKAGGFSVMGDHPQILALQSYQMVAGRFLNQPDLEERRKVAVIGTSVRDLLFEAEENPVGESIEISGVYFKVVGVLKTMQSGERGEREAQTVFVPFTTFQQAFNFGNRVGWLAVTSRPEFAASEVEEKV